MSQVSIDVEVFTFKRDTSTGQFERVKATDYKTIIDDVHAYELPMVVTKKDAKGNMLEYVACRVRPTARLTVEEASKPKRISKKAEPAATVNAKIVEIAAKASTSGKKVAPKDDEAFNRLLQSLLDD